MVEAVGQAVRMQRMSRSLMGVPQEEPVAPPPKCEFWWAADFLIERVPRATEHVFDLVPDEILDLFAGGTEVFPGIEFFG